VAPKWRLLAEALTAIALAAGGLGWATSAGDGADYLLTIVWVVGLVNAFNLMDNMDGACGAVGGISALAIGVLAALHGQTLAAGLSFALAGACGGFLPWNLAGPAKVFLGDGGSMLVGFLVAALAMAAERHLRVDGSALLTGAMLVGVPILDTALVTFSRLRRRVPLVTGGRDHLTHRILLALRSPRTVAATLAVLQGVLCAAAITGDQLGSGATAAIACSAAVLGAFAILVLDAPRWRPAGIAVGRMPLPSQAPAPSSVGVDSG
jgi:UDP-GlcNAc:undecaprenyl-phosphate GlcNAc-1-phosphate transferase